MLMGYVSDERYSALHDVALEFVDDRGRSWEARSRATGAVDLDLPTGSYTVTLQGAGFGAKRSRVSVPVPSPHQFRLLADGLIGYVWPKWVRGGEAGEFRVHSVEQYQLELWRYGWSQELVRSLGWFDEHGPRATMQITPDGDYTRTGVEWNKVGYHSTTHAQFVAAPDRSGLYYFRARTPSGSRFAFPWIVAPARPAAPLAVLASNITWNAYNNFGGRSNYIHADELPPTPTVNSRQDLQRYREAEFLSWDAPSYAPLSFDRPEPFNHIDFHERITDPIEGRQACHLAPAEWRLLGWLEDRGLRLRPLRRDPAPRRHSRPVGVPRARPLGPSRVLDPADVRPRQAVGLPGGWPAALPRRQRPELRGRDPGLGDGGPQRADHRAGRGGGRGGEPLRQASRIGGQPARRGLHARRRDDRRPYRVVDAGHWAFDGTGLKEGDLFGQKSLHGRCPGGASGHETDKLSPSSPLDARLLARGLNPDEGGAHLVHFATPRGGGVFSVGSISWVSSLPVDEHVAQITENAVRRFLD